MKRSVKNVAGDTLRLALKYLVDGRIFRFYARPASGPEPIASPRRIAVIYLIPHLGDLVMLFPLLDAIRRENPDAEISCFTYKGSKILGLHPAIDRLYEWPRKQDWREKFGLITTVFDLWSWWRRDLQELKFDISVCVRGGVDPFGSAHLGWLIGAKERVGYSSEVEPEREASDLHPDRLLTKVVPRINGVHEVERGSEVLQLAGLTHRPVDINQPVESICAIARRSDAATFKAGLPELKRPYGIIAPGASIDRRKWFREGFAAVAEQEIVARGWVPVFVGGSDVADICADIAATLSAPSLNLAGRTTFEQLVAVCEGAECFLGNDSGPAHVAGACGVPTLILSTYALAGVQSHHSSPVRSRPVGPYVSYLQPQTQKAPCTEECLADDAHCILQIEVSTVRQALSELVQRKHGAPLSSVHPQSGISLYELS